MRVTILGCGGSAGVPQVGGADGQGDWGACDPAEPRNRRSRSSIVIESDAGQRLLVDTGTRSAHAIAGLRRAAYRCRVVHPRPRPTTSPAWTRFGSSTASQGKPMPTFATEKTLSRDFPALRTTPSAPGSHPGFFRPVMEQRPFAFGDRIEAAGMQIDVFEQDHHVVQTTGLRVGQFGYSTDVVQLDDAAFETLRGVDHLAGRLLPARAASYPCPCGPRGRMVRTRGCPAHDPDPYGPGSGLVLADAEAAGRDRAGCGRHGA